MKLLIVSNMAHYELDNQIVGWGPAVEEIDHFAQFFDEVHHIACFYPGESPKSSLPYDAKNLHFSFVPPAGGERIQDKLTILRLIPLYGWTFLRKISNFDVVHVRCPANISLLVIMMLSLLRRPRLRWVKYAGNWQPDKWSSCSSCIQHWWLNKGLHRGLVTVNGNWPSQPKHVFSFLNPCFTEKEVENAEKLTSTKELSVPLRLIYAGRLESAKGIGRIIKILARIHRKGLPAVLDMVGDGLERREYEKLAVELGVAEFINFHGWIPHPQLAPLYRQAHIVIFPSDSEGWPKVLSEAMAYGVVPVASAVGGIPQILNDIGCGIALPPNDINAFSDAVLSYVRHPEKWKSESAAGRNSASCFTYEQYLQNIQQMFQDALNIKLRKL